MPRKAKRSKKRLSRGISKLMPHASSQRHSTSVEPPLQPSNSAQPFTPTITQIPSAIPIAPNLASPPDPQLHEMPHKTKHSNKRVRHVTFNLISHASSQVHSASMEPSLQHSKVAQPRTRIVTIIPPSIPGTQNMVSLSDPPLRPKPHKAKYSNKRVCRGISNLMPHASSQVHSTPLEPKPSMTAQPHAPSITFIPPSIPTAQNLVLPSDAPSSMPCKPKLSRERASLGISNFMPHASSQGHSTNVETLQQYYQSCAPTTALIPPSIPTAQNVVSPSVPPLRGV